MNKNFIKPTKIKCETKYKCQFGISKYNCKKCKLLFCEECLIKHKDHSYIKLKEVEKHNLCVGNCKDDTANVANITCKVCKKSYCWNCFKDQDSSHYKTKAYVSIELDNPDEFHTIAMESKVEPVKLFGDNEQFMIEDDCSLAKSLCLDPEEPVLVISIIGRTGDGKSHLLNETFFRGMSVFHTEKTQQRGTEGAWAAISRRGNNEPHLLLIDTEGLQGHSERPELRQRMLMKVMAVSDMVMYRTRDARVGQDVLQHVADACMAFDKHFLPQLQTKAESADCEVSALVPAFMLVHTVQHTDPYESEEKLAEAIKKSRPDKSLNLSKLFYLSYKHEEGNDEIINYKELRTKVLKCLDSLQSRNPRSLDVVAQCMKHLNDVFSADITNPCESVFPDEFFSCPLKCMACSTRCQLAMSHSGRHKNINKPCAISHKLENYVYLCTKCRNDGIVKPLICKQMTSKDDILSGTLGYVWRGMVLECDKCGIIYRSRQHWYGNKSPDECKEVTKQVVHCWSGSIFASGQSGFGIGQIWSDTLSELSSGLAEWSRPALRTVKDGIVDSCLPHPEMQPNSQITKCIVCERSLDTVRDPVHHCRQCLQGVCNKCCTKFIKFPNSVGPQKVCDNCFKQYESDPGSFKFCPMPLDQSSYQIYKIAEKTGNVLGTIAKAPLSVAKLAVRPSHWQPDHECKECPICDKLFETHWNPIHHCRACGKGVCNSCSSERRPVPSRGIDQPQRVCDICIENHLYEIEFSDDHQLVGGGSGDGIK